MTATGRLAEAKATLRLIRELDARIKAAAPKARGPLMRERMRLVLRYVALLGHGALLMIVRG